MAVKQLYEFDGEEGAAERRSRRCAFGLRGGTDRGSIQFLWTWSGEAVLRTWRNRTRPGRSALAPIERILRTSPWSRRARQTVPPYPLQIAQACPARCGLTPDDQGEENRPQVKRVAVRRPEMHNGRRQRQAGQKGAAKVPPYCTTSYNMNATRRHMCAACKGSEIQWLWPEVWMPTWDRKTARLGSNPSSPAATDFDCRCGNANNLR
jgi:hypothetical protein